MSSEIELVDEVQCRYCNSNSAGDAAAAGSGSNGDVSNHGLQGYVCTVEALGDTEKLRRLVECEGYSVSVPDGSGYYALQWAALKNEVVAARYIIEHGGDVNVADHKGQTALHWSAVRGAIQVADLLLQEGARLNASDYLDGYQGYTRRYLDKSCKTPILWCVMFLLLMIYVHSVLMVAGLAMCYRCSSNDPGFIEMSAHDPESMKDEERLLKIEMNNSALLAGNWFQLCGTCKKNKRDFFVFLVLQVSAMMVTGSVALARVFSNPMVGAVSFLVMDCFLFFFVALLTVSHAYKISHNMTTNEVENVSLYSYLKVPCGKCFRNPYDRGIKWNWMDLLIKGYHEDDVECASSLQQNKCQCPHNNNAKSTTALEASSNPQLQDPWQVLSIRRSGY